MAEDPVRPVWIVDGNNVMGSRPDGWWRDRAGAAARLVEQLEAAGPWPEGAEVVVVFDGSGPGQGVGPRRRTDSAGRTPVVEVRYAERGRSADDEIAELAAHHGPHAVVFTSDRELVGRCRAAGAAVQGAGALLHRL